MNPESWKERLSRLTQELEKGMLEDVIQISKNYGITEYSQLLPGSPRSPEQALCARYLARKQSSSGEEQAKWQRYWLSCCLSSKCDYIFAVLKECEIDRESDLMDIWKDEEVLWKWLPAEGKKYYLNACIKYLLRRYSMDNALKLWKENKENRSFWMQIDLLLPRLLGATLAGLFPLIFSEKMGEFLEALSLWDIILVIGLEHIFCILYFCYECYNATLIKKEEIIPRALDIWFRGAFYSLVLFVLVSLLMYPYFLPKINPSNLLEAIFFFSSSGLLIGIFIQIFWQKETITEPL